MATFCEWTGTAGSNCQSDHRGYIRRSDGLPLGGGVANYNSQGFYELVVTEPTVGANQVKDEIVWGFADNKITKTWTVRDLTTAELDEREASAMPLSEYYVWKVLLVKGVITQQEAVTYLPTELKDAYLARKRILGD